MRAAVTRGAGVAPGTFLRDGGAVAGPSLTGVAFLRFDAPAALVKGAWLATGACFATGAFLRPGAEGAGTSLTTGAFLRRGAEGAGTSLATGACFATVAFLPAGTAAARAGTTFAAAAFLRARTAAAGAGATFSAAGFLRAGTAAARAGRSVAAFLPIGAAARPTVVERTGEIVEAMPASAAGRSTGSALGVDWLATIVVPRADVRID